MTQYNKVLLASQIFAEAHQRLGNAARDTDYITSLMLAAATCGIVSPLLQQPAKGAFHTVLASLFKQSHDEALFGSFYEGLKHTRYKRTKISFAAVLTINADLRKEAAWMLEAAREDLSKVIIERAVLDELPDAFLKLIREPIDYVESG